MTTQSIEHGHGHEHGDEHTEHKKYPYMAVFFWLGILTAIEVSLNYIPNLNHAIVVAGLIFLSLIKATLVALYYMHLRYDKPWLAFMLLFPLFFAMLFGLVIAAR